MRVMFCAVCHAWQVEGVDYDATADEMGAHEVACAAEAASEFRG